MLGLDEWIVHLLPGSVWFLLAVSALLGLRHATDPDHLSAMLALRFAARRSSHHLGSAWGIGHGLTMLVVGAPLIFALSELPNSVQRGLEFLIGAMIVAFAIRAIGRGMAIQVHTHVHAHHNLTTHVHGHAHPSNHDHIRTRGGAFLMGLLHGAGGSASVVALILARMDNHILAYAALAVVAVFSAISMMMFSWIMYRGLDGLIEHIEQKTLAVVGGLLTLVFGVWYCAASLEMVPYPF